MVNVILQFETSTILFFVDKVGKIKTANPNDGCSIAADPNKIIIGIANPTMPLTKPATKHTATKNKVVCLGEGN